MLFKENVSHLSSSAPTLDTVMAARLKSNASLLSQSCQALKEEVSSQLSDLNNLFKSVSVSFHDKNNCVSTCTYTLCLYCLHVDLAHLLHDYKLGFR